MEEDHEHLEPQYLVVHISMHPDVPEEYRDGLDEEAFEVVAFKDGMVVMTEATLSSIVSNFPGYRDHVIIPKR